MFRESVMDLLHQTNGQEGIIYFIENDEELKLSKFGHILLDYLNIDLNDKKILTKIYDGLKQKSLEEFEKYSEIVDKVAEYIQDIISDECINLEQMKNIEPIDLFKGVSLSIAANEMTETEKVIEYLILLTETLNIKVFILVNLKQFFPVAELQLLYDTFLSKKMKVVLVESSYQNKCDSREEYYVFDDDCCEI